MACRDQDCASGFPLVSSNLLFRPPQSRAGPDGKPLTEGALVGERTRMVEALAKLDENIAQALKDLQSLTRPDERELYESRLIILQVCGEGSQVGSICRGCTSSGRFILQMCTLTCIPDFSD